MISSEKFRWKYKKCLLWWNIVIILIETHFSWRKDKSGIHGKLLRTARAMYQTVKSCVKSFSSFSVLRWFTSVRGDLHFVFYLFVEDLGLYLQNEVNSDIELYGIVLNLIFLLLRTALFHAMLFTWCQLVVTFGVFLGWHLNVMLLKVILLAVLWFAFFSFLRMAFSILQY